MTLEQPNFEQSNIEKKGPGKTGKYEKLAEEEYRRVFSYMEKNMSGFRTEGFPAQDNGMIDEKCYSGVYSQEILDQDKKYVEIRQEEFAKESLEKAESGGEDLEVAKTVIFQKKLGKRFVILRSSRYDNIRNKVDNVILDRETGNVICAIDDIESGNSERFRTKTSEVHAKNQAGGAELKYGFIPRRQKENIKFDLGKVRNVPVFFLAVPGHFVKNSIKYFDSNPEKIVESEEVLFKACLDEMKFQIDDLLTMKSLNTDLKWRLGAIRDFLKEYTEAKKEK